MIKIPKGQKKWVNQYDINGKLKQIITSDELGTKYFLYNVNTDGSLTKIETANEPIFKKDMFN